MRRAQWVGFLSGLAVLARFSPIRVVSAAEDQPTATVCSVEQLVRMNRCELDELYRASLSASIPDGSLRGTAVALPGSKIGPAASKLSRAVWQGKNLCNADGLH